MQRAFLGVVQWLQPLIARRLKTAMETPASPALRFLIFSLPCVAFIILFYDAEARIERWPLEVSQYPSLRDFANLWSGGIAALNGQFGALFDKTLHADTVGRLLGIPAPPLMWSYPPTALLPVLPLALLPYLPACAVIGLYICSGRNRGRPFGECRAARSDSVMPGHLHVPDL